MNDSATFDSKAIRSFRQLTVWQSAMDLTVEMHRVSLSLPSFERYDLARDLRRTSRSIPSNVAEGFCRHSRAAYRSHVGIALGSDGELETQVELARLLDYIPAPRADALIARVETVGRMLQGLYRSLEAR